MMNKLIKLVLYFLSILTLALAIALISAQGITTVSLADFEANPGSTIKAPLMIYNVTDVVGGELNTSFNPSVVHVTDISEGDIGTTTSNINNEAGWAYMNVFGAEEKSGDVAFAYLNLTAVGSERESSSLNISVISLFNTNYMDISYKTDNETFAIRDITPPASISNLRNATGNFWINWMWTNPSDNDFNHTMVYLDGTWQTNTSNSYYNATGLNPDTTYEIGTHTVDTSGNVNNTLVNQRAKTLALNSAPVADPNGPYTGMEGVVIAFDGSGSYDPDGSIVAYEWDFGDGNTSSEVSPTHTYTQNGTYTVTLTVTDNDGATDTNTTTAMVADTEPTADFTATPTSGFEPLTVAFTDKSTSYDGITAWEWDFDSDGVIDSNVQNPTHVYTEEGVYTVSLTVYESDGDSDTMAKADYITVTKVNKAPYTPANPSPSDGATDVLIEAILSWTGGDPDVDDTVTYDVYFGTSTSPPLVAENQLETTYDPGTLDHSTGYYWQIVATDNHDVSNESDIWSFTTAASPGPDLVGEWHFDEGTGEIAVDSSGNSNDGALVNNPAWVTGKIEKALRFDGVNAYINIPNSPGLNPADEISIIAWVKPGVIPQSGWNKIIAKPYTSYTSPWQQYALTLHDNQFVFELNTEGTKDGLIGTGTLDPNTWYHVAGTYDGSEMRIYINAELNGTQPKSGAIAQYPTNVHIGAGIYSYAQEEYINGTVDEVKIYNWALGAEEIRADYEAGASNSPPVSDSSGPYTGTEGVVIAFDGSGSYDTDGSTVAYEWDFGDGNTATGVTPTHTYAQDGTYTVTLKVTDNDGATNTSTTTATIADTEPTADFSASPSSGQEPLTVTFSDNSTSYDGIEAWNWDFNNDSVTDSNVQNPTHVYTEEGVYTVSLTVYESDGDSDTMAKADYITVTKVNKAPYRPANPSPSDGATDVLIEAILSWTGGDPDVDDTVTCDVYFGTSTSPPLVAENQPGTTYDPGTLDHSTGYYWQIVAKDNHDVSNESDIWSFTTAASPGSDLAAEWHLDEETGEIAVDSSGNGNDGTLVNNPARVKGKIGKALRFDGETDYISIPDSPSLNPADEITIIAWVKPGIIPQSGWNKIIAKPYTSYTSPWQQYALTLHDNQFVFELNTEGTKDGITGTGTLDPNTWYHVAGTYDGSEMRIYINAQLNGTQPKSGAIAQYPTNVHIGAGIYSDAQVEYINGIVDEVKIYNWALGAEEIRADYEAGSSNQPPTAIIDSITPDLAEKGKDTVSFTGHGTDTDGSIIAYSWSSSIDGLLSTASSFSKPASELSVGMHTIYFKVQDDEGAWSTEVMEDLIIIEPANQPPYTPTEPSPSDGATDVPVDAVLCWTGGDPDAEDTVTYDVYFGTSISPPLVVENQPENTYDPGTLDYRTGYYWQIVATDNHGATTEGEVWAFTTAAVPNEAPNTPAEPSPSDSATDVSIDAVVLSWTGGDPDAEDTVTYDVYFGTSISPPLVVENQPENTYDPGTLDHSTLYYWQIVATDNHGATTEGEVWAFTTAAAPNEAPNTPAEPSPSDSATDVSIDAVVLSWTGGDPDAEDTVTYDVYFGTSISPPLTAENQPENTYDLGTLDHSTLYYWQIVATDNHDATTEGEVWAFTTTAAPDTPPIVSNPSATPDTILNDNGRPRIPGTNISQLSVTVTDDTEIDTVTIDLSPIGGSYEAQMTNIPGTDTWTITTNAVEGINIAHDLIVTATDTSGNSDSSVSIQLTILRRGDVDHDNDVDRADLMKIKYSMRNALGVFIADVYPATGDNVVDRKDVFYIFDYVNGKADEP